MSALTRLHTAVAFGGSAVLALTLSGCGALGGSDEPEASSSPTASEATPSVPASPTLAPTRTVAEPAGFVFPITAKTSFGRTHHDYPATDIFADCGSLVVAPTDGVISEVSTTDTWDRTVNDGANRGGLSWSMVGAEGVRYYGSHLSAIGTKIRPGAEVAMGDVLGKVGHTGDAANVPCHLHFGISPACGEGDWWIRRGRISPYRYLKAWQRGEDLDPAQEIAAWKKKNGCSKTPPKGY